MQTKIRVDGTNDLFLVRRICYAGAKEVKMKETIRQYPAPQAGEKELLRQRALDGAERRFGALEGERKERLFYELQLVRKMQAEGLFLLWERAISAVKRVVFPYVLSAQDRKSVV